jgi:hypothetical protein
MTWDSDVMRARGRYMSIVYHRFLRLQVCGKGDPCAAPQIYPTKVTRQPVELPSKLPNTLNVFLVLGGI